MLYAFSLVPKKKKKKKKKGADRIDVAKSIHVLTTTKKKIVMLLVVYIVVYFFLRLKIQYAREGKKKKSIKFYLNDSFFC